MKTLLSVLVSCTLWSMSYLVHAGTWKYGMKVEGVQSLAGGGFIIYGPSNTEQECPEGRLFYVRTGHYNQSADGVKTALSITLVAFSSLKTITFLYDESTSGCDVNTILIDR